MTTTVKISCDVCASGPGLYLTARVDDEIFFQGDPHEKQTIEVELSDQDGDHELIFEMSGKTAEHTKVSADGTIVHDVIVQIDNITLDEIELTNMVTQLAQYQHDFNGTQSPITDKFFGSMGCNGTVTLRFKTPIYLWLLEHM